MEFICCTIKHIESLDHVLCSGDLAKQVWDLAGAAFDVSCMQTSTWWAQVSSWFACAKKSSLKGSLVGMVPCLITWKLWHRRCKARMEGNLDNTQSVWFTVKFWLSRLAGEITKTGRLSFSDEQILTSLDISVPP